jgi:hypothetical protein
MRCFGDRAPHLEWNYRPNIVECSGGRTILNLAPREQLIAPLAPARTPAENRGFST